MACFRRSQLPSLGISLPALICFISWLFLYRVDLQNKILCVNFYLPLLLAIKSTLSTWEFNSRKLTFLRGSREDWLGHGGHYFKLISIVTVLLWEFRKLFFKYLIKLVTLLCYNTMWLERISSLIYLIVFVKTKMSVWKLFHYCYIYSNSFQVN